MKQIPTARGNWQAAFGWEAVVDNFSNEELFSTIVSSNILTPYLHGDPELTMPLEHPHQCNIHDPLNYSSADQILPVLHGMLDYMVAQRIYSNLDATRQLIFLGQKNPDSRSCDVTFNCERQSYGVCCGQLQDQLHVICVLTGKHITDELFGETAW